MAPSTTARTDVAIVSGESSQRISCSRADVADIREREMMPTEYRTATHRTSLLS